MEFKNISIVCNSFNLYTQETAIQKLKKEAQVRWNNIFERIKRKKKWVKLEQSLAKGNKLKKYNKVFSTHGL